MKRTPTIPVWARKITVEAQADLLIVRGEGRRIMPFFGSGDLPRKEDLLGKYLHLNWNAVKGAPIRGPHLEFANAKDDSDLISFVESYGPVFAKKCEITAFDEDTLTCSLEAHQELVAIRHEKDIFAGALRTMLELRRGRKADRSIIASSLKEVARADIGPLGGIDSNHTSKSEGATQFLVASAGLANSADELSQDAVSFVLSVGHAALCNLLNRYPPTLQHFEHTVLEFPSYEEKGVRSVLYYMLRQDYLHNHGLGVCARTDCGKFFSMDRYGQRFCSPRCSQLQRQRDYWHARGTDLRKARQKPKRKKSVPQRRNAARQRA